MAIEFHCEYEGIGEADAIREWCRKEIGKIRVDRDYLFDRGITGPGSRDRSRRYDKLGGEIRSLRRLIKTRFIEGFTDEEQQEDE